MSAPVVLHACAICGSQLLSVTEEDSIYGLGSPTEDNITSVILDGNGQISIDLMVKEWLHLQSGSTTRSEKVVWINPKFTLGQVIELEGDCVVQVKAKETAHRLHVAQHLNISLQAKMPKKDRESQWMNIVSNIKGLVVHQGMYVIETWSKCSS